MGIEQSPRYKRRAEKRRRRQEQAWSKKSGPVKVRWVDPVELRRQSPRKLR